MYLHDWFNHIDLKIIEYYKPILFIIIMKISTLKTIVLFFLLLWSVAGMTQVTLPPFFNCNMVLQKGIEIPVWGWAKPGEKVTVTLERKKWKMAS